MGREFELKYRADPEKIDAIRQKFSGFTPITMVTAYYDTPEGALRQRRWTLRRRLENGRSVCTVKTPKPDGSRGEWELECPSIDAAVPELCNLGAPEELMTLTTSGLTEVCAARFTRLAATLKISGCTVELALDQGSLLGGGKELPFAEVEAELKDGSEIACVAFAEGLAREFSLVPEPLSKVQRAMALAQT
ncbi:MAG: CYTH domain-containing protein [Faecousia sp.]